MTSSRTVAGINRDNAAFKERCWRNLMRYVDKMGYGTLQLEIQDGVPVRVVQALKSVKLGVDEVA